MTGSRLRCLEITALMTIAACSVAVGEDEKTTPRWVTGGLDVTVDAERDDNDSDMNLDQTLRLRIAPPGHPEWSTSAAFWFSEDADGHEARASALRDIDDAFDSDFLARVLYLHVDAEDLWGDSVLRVGRQRILEGLAYNRIDGAYFRQQLSEWDWYAFGGWRASLYENAHDDVALGAGVGYRPDGKTRLAVDSFYGEDKRDSADAVYWRTIFNPFSAGVRRANDDLNDMAIAFSIWRDLATDHRMYARYLWKDGGGDEARVSLSGGFDAWQLGYELNVRAQLNQSGDQVADLSGFYRILGVFEPYCNVFAVVHRSLSKRVHLSIEAELNDAENDDPLSPNRDYQRYALIFSFDEITPGTEASLTLEDWRVSGAEGSFALTGEITHEWEKVSLTVGADFERFEDRYVDYNPLPSQLTRVGFALRPSAALLIGPFARFFDTRVVETHENIYSTFVESNWDFRDNQRFKARLTREQDDGPGSPYWRLQAGYSVTF